MGSTQMEEGLSEKTFSEAENTKCCSDCKVTSTPCWRSGPSGPKSLCNACGIRYRKKKRHVLQKGKSGEGKNVKKMRSGLKMNVMFPLERELMKEGLLPVTVKKQRSRRQHWGEVERAALLLMALSCGALFVA